MCRWLIVGLALLCFSCEDKRVVSYEKCKGKKSFEQTLNNPQQNLTIIFSQYHPLEQPYLFLNEQNETLSYEIYTNFKGYWDFNLRDDPWIKPLMITYTYDSLAQAPYTWIIGKKLYNYSVH